MLEYPTIAPPKINPTTIDRPAWIPPEITHDWDTNPYAYQTEEELMPAGGYHGQLLAYIMELLRHFLAGKDLMLLLDTFMLYRDAQGLKQRVSPDLLLMPWRAEIPTVYDLDIEAPPSCVVEVTSQNSHTKDLQDNVSFYFGLGVQTYLVIDAVTSQGKARSQIYLHLWRSVKGTVQKLSADAEGYFTLPEMDLKIRAIGQQIIFVDALTDKVLFDISDFSTALASEQKMRDILEKACQAAEEALQAEQEALQAEQEARQAAEASAAEARQVRNQEIALTMWHKGLDMDLIIEVTGMSETALRKLVEMETNRKRV